MSGFGVVGADGAAAGAPIDRSRLSPLMATNSAIAMIVKSKSAKECVTTHLPNGVALKMDGAEAGYRYQTNRIIVMFC